MKAQFLVALTALSGVMAAPLVKRGRVTITHEVVEYVHVTSTVWVKAAAAHAATTTTVPAYHTPAPAPEQPENEYTGNKQNPEPAVKVPFKKVSPPKYTPPPPPPPPVYVAPSPPPAPVYVAPSPPPAPVYTPPAPVQSPSPVYTPPAPVQSPSPVVEYPQPQPPTPKPKPVTEKPAGGSGSAIIGEATYYDPGMGACGSTSTGDDLIAAIGTGLYEKTVIGGNPNNNPVCGKKIKCSINGAPPITVTVVDRCPGCTEKDLDLSPAAFKAAGGIEGNGREEIHWEWVDY